MFSIEQKRELVLLFGVTGPSGFHIANRFIQSKNYPVRVVVRNRSKLQSLFKQKQMAFESIIQGDITNQQTLRKAFQSSKHYGPVKIVISSLGSALFDSEQNVEKVESTGVTNIIKHSKQNKVSNFILISGSIMERPWHIMTVLINTLIPNLYHHKSIAQNALRKSGLNYIILRPPLLTGNFEQSEPTEYLICQKSRNGSISRRTLGSVVFDALDCKQMPSKVTFECYQSKGKQKIEREKPNFSLLKADTQNSIVKNRHKLAKYTYWSIFLFGTAGGLFALANKYDLLSKFK